MHLEKSRLDLCSDTPLATPRPITRVCGCTPICYPCSSSHSLLSPWGTCLTHINNCMSMKTSSMLFVTFITMVVIFHMTTHDHSHLLFSLLCFAWFVALTTPILFCFAIMSPSSSIPPFSLPFTHTIHTWIHEAVVIQYQTHSLAAHLSPEPSANHYPKRQVAHEHNIVSNKNKSACLVQGMFTTPQSHTSSLAHMPSHHRHKAVHELTHESLGLGSHGSWLDLICFPRLWVELWIFASDSHDLGWLALGIRPTVTQKTVPMFATFDFLPLYLHN